MATRQKTVAASESPFDRYGAQVLDEPRVALWPLERGASIYTIAHQVLGEWRLWRSICDANGVADPFDLEGAALELAADGGPTPAPFLFAGVPDGADPVTHDLSSQDELGVGPLVLDASPALVGDVVLQLEDVDFGSFELSIRGPDDADFGPRTPIALASFEGPTEAASATVTLLLYAASGAGLTLQLNLNALLVVWLARYWPLALSVVDGSARTALAVPLDDDALVQLGVV